MRKMHRNGLRTARGITFLTLVAAFAVTTAQAVPLSVNIEDHDFTFDVPISAVYDFAGAAPDHLYVVDGGEDHFVHGYTYSGIYPTVPASIPISADPYPVYSGVNPTAFGGDLELKMFFDGADGPYTNPSGDTFEISLTGTQGHLTITGFIADQAFPPSITYPSPPTDIVLLDITFDQVSLLARAGSDTIDLIEGRGTVNMLLGAPLAQIPFWEGGDGVTYFKFMAPLGTPIFPMPAAAPYFPWDDYGLDPVGESRISGEAGIPEPATMAMLALGGMLVAARRRNRKK